MSTVSNAKPSQISRFATRGLVVVVVFMQLAPVAMGHALSPHAKARSAFMGWMYGCSRIRPIKGGTKPKPAVVTAM